jgi:hypothetical protein
MKLEVNSGALQLARGQTLKLCDGMGSTLCALNGTVWITEEHSRKDVVLENGACHRIAHQGLTLVQAFDNASVAFA